VNLSYSPQEIAAIAIVLGLVELVKKRVPRKYNRYLPLPFGFFLAACIIIENQAGFPGWWVFLAQEIQIGLKISFAAMGLFDLIFKPKKTTAQDSAQDEKKEGLE
jgi:hypothetical protein